MDGPRLLTTVHRFFAVETNNAAWRHIEAGEAGPALENAWASLLHWRAAGGPVHVARAYGTVSRAYAAAGEGAPALRHAEAYLGARAGEGWEEWDLPFALGAAARAHGLLGGLGEARRLRGEAAAAAEALDDPDDRAICLRDLGLGPWPD